jgi:PAS domain S-box-containing protein
MNNYGKSDQLDLTSSVEQNRSPGQESETRRQEISAGLQALAKEVATELAAKACCIYVLNQKKQTLMPLVSWSIPNVTTEFARRPLGQGVVGLAAEAGLQIDGNQGSIINPVRVDDIKTDKRFASTELDCPHNSFLAQPLVTPGSGRVLGVLLVADKIDSATFSDEDEQRLIDLASRSDLTLALQNLELAHEKQQWSDGLAIVAQINQTLANSPHLTDLRSICRTILSLSSLRNYFQYDTAEICLWDDQSETLATIERLGKNASKIETRHDTYHLNEGYTGWIANHHTSLLVRDTRQHQAVSPKGGVGQFPYHSYIGAPLKVGLKFIGTLELAATRPNSYDHNDANILEVVAGQAAVIIDHVRLQDEIQRNISDLYVLYDTSRELSSPLSYTDLVRNFSRQMIEVFPIADKCVLYNFDETASTLRSIVSYLKPEARATDAQPEESGISQDGVTTQETALLDLTKYSTLQAVFTTRTPLVIRLDEPGSTPEKSELLQQDDYGSLMAIPLVSRNKVTGLMGLFSRSRHAFNKSETRLAHSLANQVNIAMENTRLLSLTDQQLRKRVDELAGLQRISSELNSTLALDRILTLVLDEAIRVTQADYGNVNLYEARSGELTVSRAHGWPNGPEETILAQQGIMKRGLRTRKTILVPDVFGDDDFTDYGGDTRSEMVVPLLYGDESVGVINLESKQVDFFTNDQLGYLTALANHAAVAIANAQAYQEQKLERERANRRAYQLSRLSEISNAFRTNCPLNTVLEDIAYAVMESVGYDVVLISLMRGQPPVLYHEVGAGIPISQFEALQTTSSKTSLANLEAALLDEFRLGTAYLIPAERKEIWQNNLDLPYIEKVRRPYPGPSGNKAEANKQAWQIGDLLLVPLTDTQDNIIGLLTVQYPENDQRPDILTVQTLEIFANHAAVAIESARLFELEQQRRRLADTLRGVAETISSQLDIDQLLNVVLQELRKVVDYDKATVELLQDNHLEIIGGQGWEEYSQQIIGLTFSMEGENPGRMVIETQESVLVKDTHSEYPHIFSSPPYDRIRNWLGVPLTYGTNVLGLMAVGSSEIDFFNPEDADVVLAFANQFAVALQNAHLFDEARQQVRQLAALTEVAQSINRSLDLDEVLDLVLEAVFDLVGHDQGSIWLIDASTMTIKVANTKNIHNYLVELFNENAITIDAEPFASVIQSGEVQIIKSSAPTENELEDGLTFPNDVTMVPLKVEDDVVGILVTETVVHNQNMLKLVTTLADLAVVAIDNAQLVKRLNLFNEELERRVAQRTEELAQTLQDLTDERDRVETLYQITRELSSSLDLDRVLIEALNLINRAIGISHGSILLLDQGSGELLYRAALGRDKPLPRGGTKTQYRLGFGLAGVVMETNQARIVPELSQDADWILNKETPDRRSALAVPLATGEGLMGALLLFHPDAGYFSEDHLKLVTAAGTQIANAINNAGLYRLITDQAERLGTMLRTEATEAAKNQAILRSVADGVLVLDNWRNIVLLNPKAAEILNVDPDVVENQPINKILVQPEASEEAELTQLFHDSLLKYLKEIEAGQATAEFRIEAGKMTLVVTLTPLKMPSDESLSVVAVVRDISKEAEIERMKNEFISTVSHELRTPMTSVKGYADLLVSGNVQIGELNETQRRFVTIIQSNANRLTDLVNEILELSRIETGRVKLHFETLDLIELIKEVAVSFDGQMVQKTMDLTLDLPAQLPEVQTDKARMTQILVNLIGNAWQYSPEHGRITVMAQLLGDNRVQIDVADNGIGIPEEEIDKIFERFYRSQRREVEMVDGTGLGLAITKSFVELLGGEISVKSELNVGTTFSFTIPLESPEQAAAVDQPDFQSEPPADKLMHTA